jgi:hypothetical protein
MSSYLPQPPNPGAAGWSPVGPYATSSMPMPPMRSLKGLSVALLVLFILAGLIEIAAAGARFNRADAVANVADSGFSFDAVAELSDADDTVVGLSGAHVLLVISLGIVFIIWQFRHAKNAETLGVRGGLGPGWAIGGWFVPLANAVLPTVQIFQSSKGSDTSSRLQGRQPRGAGIVIAWGILLVLGSGLLGVGGALAPQDEDVTLGTFGQDLEDQETSDRTAGLGHVVLVSAAVAATVMVRTLTKKQTAAYGAVAAGAVVAGPPPSAPSAPMAPGTAWGAPPPPAAPAPPPPPPAGSSVPPPPGAPAPPE